MQEIKLTREYQEGIDWLNENDSGFLFLTGKAGTGKSTFLSILPEHCSKRMVKIAPTGIAALNIGGETIHSFFEMGIQMDYDAAQEKDRVCSKLIGVDIIVIDEISMVRADLMDKIDDALRYNTSSGEPFGGKIILAIGDLFQLPPVIQRNESKYFYDLYDTPYFFSAKVFKEEIDIITLELSEIFRQKDERFINFLNETRVGEVSDQKLRSVNNHYSLNGCSPKEFSGVTLCTVNKKAETINNRKLAEIENESHYFTAIVQGKVNRGSYPVPVSLELKEGAKVLFCRNSAMYKNGEVGVVEKISDEDVKVRKDDGLVVTVEKSTWEYYAYEEGGSRVVGKFTQIPLKLGWAVTIHKSQGMTIADEVIVDTGTGCFADGQFYVAVSRVTNPKNLKFLNEIRQGDIRSSEVVKYFMSEEFD